MIHHCMVLSLSICLVSRRMEDTDFGLQLCRLSNICENEIEGHYLGRYVWQGFKVKSHASSESKTPFSIEASEVMCLFYPCPSKSRLLIDVVVRTWGDVCE